MISNIAPTLINVNVTPKSPDTNAVLLCNVSATDFDSDGLTYYYSWFNDEIPISGETGQTYDCGNVGCDKANSITCRVIASDSTDNSTALNDTVVIINTLPTASDVIIKPDIPITNNDLTCQYTYSDSYNDAESSTFLWYKDNVLQGLSGQVISNANTGDGEVWRCTVIPGDGEENGTAINSSTKTIGSSAPAIVSLTDDSNASNPTNLGNQVTFNVNWADIDQPSENARIYVCNTTDINASGCNDREFCSTANAVTDPVSCAYTTFTNDNISLEFYVIVFEN